MTGALLDATGSWSWALFAPSAFLFVTGVGVFTTWGSADLQQFDGSAAGPFWCAVHGVPSDQSHSLQVEAMAVLVRMHGMPSDEGSDRK